MLFETCFQLICLSIEHGLSKIAKQKVNKIKKNELNLKKEFIDNIDIHNNDDILPYEERNK